jgi:hypothetical protein
VFYWNPATNDTIASTAVESYGDYAAIVLLNPLHAAAGYALHVFNGLDVRYPTPYVHNLEEIWLPLTLLQATLLFLAALRLALKDARRALGHTRWVGVIGLVVPCLTAIPSAMEPRFLLPLHVLVYMLVCFAPGWSDVLVSRNHVRTAAIASSYVAFVTLWLIASKWTESYIEFPLA